MKISREFKIGLVSLVAIALLLWGINYLKGISIFRKSTNYYAVYSNIGGLIESASVYVNGYKIGNVAGIEFNSGDINNIRVEFALNSKVQLPRNTIAEIKSSSLISGTKDIYLTLGDGPDYYQPGDTIMSLVESDMLAFLDPLVTKIDTMILYINDLLNESNRENLGNTLATLEITMNSLKRSLQPGGDLSSTFGNLESVTGNLRENNEKISVTLGNLASFTDTLNRSGINNVIRRVDTTFAQVSKLVGNVNSGQGTAGALITNDSLYANLNSSLASLDSLLTDLREHPGRYVRFSVFGGRDK